MDFADLTQHRELIVSAMAAVQAVGHALFKAMKYDAEATDVHTPPAEAFAARHGVCQWRT